jgi:hypothetical protein
MDKLSIVDAEQKIDLGTNKSDAASMGLKVIGGLIPFGSLISEIVATVIPNQRADRVVLMVEILNDKLSYLEKEIVEQKMIAEEFTDLLQDGFNQASRALTRDRLEQIASALKNSLTDEQLVHIEKKKLLSLVGELNDAEIICLQYHALYPDERESYMEKHNDTLLPSWTSNQSSFSEFDSEALQRNHTEELIRRGLLTEKFNLNLFRGQMPEYDPETGRPKRSGLEVSTLGNALLRIIDLLPSDDQNRRFYWNT